MSSKGLQEFQLDLSNFGKLVPEKHRLLCGAITMRVLSGVVYKSPVLTGAFRGNWQTSSGTPSSGTLPVRSLGEVLSEGVKIAASVGNFPFIWVGNNLAYGPRLEDGWSKQAPAGMVELTLVEIQNFVNTVSL